MRKSKTQIKIMQNGRRIVEIKGLKIKNSHDAKIQRLSHHAYYIERRDKFARCEF